MFGSFFHPDMNNETVEGEYDMLTFPEVMNEELHFAFEGMSKEAVARQSTVCYRSMGWILEQGLEEVRHFYNGSLAQGYIPASLKQNNGIIIVKPDLTNASTPKNY